MADERVANDPTEELAALRKEFDDFKSTMAVRVTLRPTGDIEPTIRATAKIGTLFCQGQTVNRADYAILWQYAQDNSMVVAGLFGAGNGTTTFVLPDFRGRTPVGAGTLGSDTYALGATGGSSTKTIAITNLPSHDHGVSGNSNSAGGHSHGGSTDTDGSHGGHSSGTTNVVPPGSGVTLPANYSGSAGSHNHGITTDSQGSHSHSLSLDVTPTGGGTPLDVRQAYLAVNWMIYI